MTLARLLCGYVFIFCCWTNSPFASPPGAKLLQEESVSKPLVVPEKVDFTQHIKPIFEVHCLECHGPDGKESPRIDDRDSVSDYIEPEDADGSELFEVLTTDDEDVMMPPPDEENPLSEVQIEIIRKWIDNGADWPENIAFVKPVGQKTQLEKKSELTMGERIWSAIGDLHPAAVHLPIGLLLAAGLFSLLGLRGNFVMSDSAYYCLWLGALTAIVASVVGWSYAAGKGAGIGLEELTDTNNKFFLHRISGVAVTVFGLILALYAARARALDPDDGFLWKLGAIFLALGVAYCGHEGGELAYPSHYSELNAVTEDLTGMDINSDGKVGAGPAKTVAGESQDKPIDSKPKSPTAVVPEDTANENRAAIEETIENKTKNEDDAVGKSSSESKDSSGN